MELGEGLIYYISKNNVDTWYKEKFGPIEEHQIENNQESEGEIKGGFSLGKLAEALSGLKFSAEGRTKKRDEKKNLYSVKESIEDRTLVLLRSYTVPDVRDMIAQEMKPKNLYAFNLKLKLSEHFEKKGEKTFIEISHQSDGLRFSGRTSPENWLSESLLNTIITQPDDFTAAGILSPLFKTKNDGWMVSYLIICQPSLIEGTK